MGAPEDQLAHSRNRVIDALDDSTAHVSLPFITN